MKPVLDLETASASAFSWENRCVDLRGLVLPQLVHTPGPAFADGISHAILVPARVKTEGFRALRRRGKSKEIAYLLLFSACLYLLLRDHLANLQRITIDQEYWGQEDRIRSFLLEHIKRDGQFFDLSAIHFDRVGRGSLSDEKARAVREGKDEDYREITLEEMLEGESR